MRNSGFGVQGSGFGVRNSGFGGQCLGFGVRDSVFGVETPGGCLAESQEVIDSGFSGRIF